MDRRGLIINKAMHRYMGGHGLPGSPIEHFAPLVGLGPKTLLRRLSDGGWLEREGVAFVQVLGEYGKELRDDIVKQVDEAVNANKP